jgi:hypothetical protein
MDSVGLRYRHVRRALHDVSRMGLLVKPVQYLFPIAQEAAPMVERQLSLAGFAEIASKRANRICCGEERASFIARSSTISHSLRL